MINDLQAAQKPTVPAAGIAQPPQQYAHPLNAGMPPQGYPTAPPQIPPRPQPQEVAHKAYSGNPAPFMAPPKTVRPNLALPAKAMPRCNGRLSAGWF